MPELNQILVVVLTEVDSLFGVVLICAATWLESASDNLAGQPVSRVRVVLEDGETVVTLWQGPLLLIQETV